MAHIIEAAKSGRASCRKCKEKIEKDELRFGHEVDSSFSDEPSYQWYHLNCAAEKLPVNLGEALSVFGGDVSGREELEATVAANRKKQKPSEYPYAERASSSRSTCIICEEKIEKGEFRVAVEREVDTGSFTRMGPGYMHPGCVSQYEEVPDDLEAQLRAHSFGLDPAELDELEAKLNG